MRNFIVIILGFLTLSACSKSDKIKELTEATVKSYLFIPDSYESVSLEWDSAFVYIYTPQNLKNAQRIYNLSFDISSEVGVALDTLFFQSTGSSKKVEEFKQLVSEIGKDFKEQKDKHEFIGYGVTHRYRAENNLGQVGINECIILFDKELKTAIGGLDSGNFNSVIQFKTIDEILSLGDNAVTGDYEISILADRISDIRFR